MISVTAATRNYILQPSLVEMHRKTLEWLSSTSLWKKEINFFQKMLNKYSPCYTSLKDKQRISHFQNLIIYYSAELITELNEKLHAHEGRLAHMLQEKNESDTLYYKEHNNVMEEMESFSKAYRALKSEFFDFIELAI